MERFLNIEEFILKYLLYSFPLLIIFGNAIVNLVFILISILYFFSCFIQKKVVFVETYEFKYFFFFYLYLLFNSILAENITISLTRSLPYLKFFIFVLVFRNFVEQKKVDLKIVGYFWFGIIFILSLDIIYQSIYGYDVFNYVSEYSTRNSGFF